MTPPSYSHAAGMDAERLLADTRWLKRLARGLVADDSSAEDLAQETWLAALRARAPAASELHPDGRTWLTGVLRNLAWKQRRTHARRTVRERRGAREESLPSTGSLVARAEMQRAISDAVVALDEPMRTTILLRYIEELSSAEIARRQGVPEGTVRWRVKRGLELLRERLEERRGGDWLHGCALLAGLTRAPEAALAGSTAVASGGFTLKAASALTAGLALTGGGIAVGTHWNGLDSGATLAQSSIETAGGSGAPSIASTTSTYATAVAGMDEDRSSAAEEGGAGATRIRIPLAVRSDEEREVASAPAEMETTTSRRHVSIHRARSGDASSPEGDFTGELANGSWAVLALNCADSNGEPGVNVFARSRIDPDMDCDELREALENQLEPRGAFVGKLDGRPVSIQAQFDVRTFGDLPKDAHDALQRVFVMPLGDAAGGEMPEALRAEALRIGLSLDVKRSEPR